MTKDYSWLQDYIDAVNESIETQDDEPLMRFRLSEFQKAWGELLNTSWVISLPQSHKMDYEVSPFYNLLFHLSPRRHRDFPVLTKCTFADDLDSDLTPKHFWLTNNAKEKRIIFIM